MKVAIVHPWFAMGGGEKVISALVALYPNAHVYCLFGDQHALPKGLSLDQVHTSFLNDIPLARRMNRVLFPLHPAAVGAFDLSGYDLVISSDSPPTKAIVPVNNTVHISYCHTPPRFIWDLAPRFIATLPGVVRPLFAVLADYARTSDFVAAQRLDHFVANSRYIQQRIRKYYGRYATVIYPPVDTSRGFLSESCGEYFLSVGRLVMSKRIDLLIDACNRLGCRLIIVGTGREEKRLKAMAGPTIEFLGYVPDAQLPSLYANCRALLFAADEDFGIVSVEAQSFGRPVIAYGAGGSLETVRVGDPQGRSDTGVFFSEQTVESVVKAILRFDVVQHNFIPREIQEVARRFDTAVFMKQMHKFANDAIEMAGSWTKGGASTNGRVHITPWSTRGKRANGHIARPATRSYQRTGRSVGTIQSRNPTFRAARTLRGSTPMNTT